jgi:hypothetical protein
MIAHGSLPGWYGSRLLSKVTFSKHSRSRLISLCDPRVAESVARAPLSRVRVAAAQSSTSMALT